MILAVLVALLSPICVAPAGSGGSTSLVTLDVCSDAGTGTVASGDITFIHQSADPILVACCSVPAESAESAFLVTIFSSGIERPPQA
jgi:hypothetical protein